MFCLTGSNVHDFSIPSRRPSPFENLLTNVRKRGYELVEPYKSMNWSNQASNEEYFNTQTILLKAERFACPRHSESNRKTDEGCKLIVIFPRVEKFGKSDADEITQTYLPLIPNSCDRILMIYHTMTPMALRELSRLIKIQLMEAREFKLNIIDHSLVVPHRKLSDTEVKELLIKHKSELSCLPVKSTTDRIVRYYGFEQGDVIACTSRYDASLAEHVEYYLVNKVSRG